MPILLKRAYQKAEPEDGYRVLVDRIWPRGVSKDAARIDEWMKVVAPSSELRKWFHEDRSRWDDFRERYLAELAIHREELRTLAQLAERSNVTLVYSARDEERNNAVVLMEYLQRFVSDGLPTCPWEEPMTHSYDLEQLGAKGTAILRARLHANVTLREPELLKDQTRSIVVRYRLDTVQKELLLPNSVVIKHSRDDASLGFSEWASLAFLDSLPEVHKCVPRFLVGDATNHFFVMEDLGSSRCIEDVLNEGDSVAAKTHLQKLARTMARMCAATFHHEEAFHNVRRKLPKAGDMDRSRESERWLENSKWIAEWFQAIETLVPEGFDACLVDIAKAYAQPGPFLSFSHGDPAPTNNHVRNECVRLLDFEYGGFRHALYDLSAWNVLCPLPADCVNELKAAFRNELANVRTCFSDESRFNEAWASLSAFRALAILTWIKPDVLGENRPWVDERWTCRHAVLAAVDRMFEVTCDVSKLQPVNRAAVSLREMLRKRWPEFDRSRAVIPEWPAFSGASEALSHE